jgi:hypothetical protein
MQCSKYALQLALIETTCHHLLGLITIAWALHPMTESPLDFSEGTRGALRLKPESLLHHINADPHRPS